MSSVDGTIRVAMIGHGFMGAAHSQAWRTAPVVADLPRSVRRSVVVGRDAARAAAAADRLGWESSATDWRDVIARDDIDLVDICTPGSSHAEIAVTALEAGKHVLCEKPLANSVAEAERMAAAAATAADHGVVAMVGFSYRRVPALRLAHDLVRAGRIGDVRQVRATYDQDWLADPDGPMTWRLDQEQAGSGALGDIGAHAIDAVEYVTGAAVERVSGLLHTFTTERPVMTEAVGLGGRSAADAPRRPVTVDDLALITARLSDGSIGQFGASRVASGRKNALRIEISGTTGAVAFDLERLNELAFHDATLPETEQGFRQVLVTDPGHPWVDMWWPAGHVLGWEHAFTHQVVDLVTAIADSTRPEPSFADGLHVQRVLDAVARSADADGSWADVPADSAADVLT
ncbi:Gfo/Idh/MocA family oxidoreductase [Curtobacterium sp. MCBD17_003]|uniref:Gfo/Idh/MocA family protein n=1 Tax=Curtobacterium sp. MCBD17_003 TaxID=2175667 RepID=UPI0021ACD525|nr:Gfo/Idh/MocA family oxidoreductase [Curtobacterium sp. MCBD17_003]WIE55923.1 Gfo/Idh/MocA family oxidoreductase [Curtobacterium sp. MCBD17_003]